MNLFRRFRDFVRVLHAKHGWVLTETGLRTKIEGEGETCFCPLTYVYYVKSGGVARSVNDYGYCATYLGLDMYKETIAVAADDQKEDDAASDTERRIHRILHRACGVRKQQHPSTPRIQYE